MLKQPALAEQAGIHKDRLRAILGESNTKDVRLEELYAIAKVAGVPESFVLSGWTTEAERSAQLEEAQRRLEARLVVLEAEVLGRSEGRGRSNPGHSQ